MPCRNPPLWFPWFYFQAILSNYPPIAPFLTPPPTVLRKQDLWGYYNPIVTNGRTDGISVSTLLMMIPLKEFMGKKTWFGHFPIHIENTQIVRHQSVMGLKLWFSRLVCTGSPCIHGLYRGILILMTFEICNLACSQIVTSCPMILELSFSLIKLWNCSPAELTRSL